MSKSCKIEEKYLFKQILVGILILLGELLIGRAANFPKISVEFVPVEYESSQVLYK